MALGKEPPQSGRAMDTPLLQALAGLQSAYERLGLDPHAQGEERASVWRVWAREHRLDDLAEAPLLRSVLRALAREPLRPVLPASARQPPRPALCALACEPPHPARSAQAR